METLEQENKSLQQRFKRERETLDADLNEKKEIILRYGVEIKEVG